VVGRLLTLVLLVAMSLLVGAPRVLSYVCTIDGRTRASCCCDAHGAHIGPSDAAQLQHRGCCEVEADDVDLQAAALRATQFSSVVVSVPVQLPDVPVAGSCEARTSTSARGPPSTGPPLFIRNCRFLI
jgi:hypothetical protein